jgi:uncharacterized lipoprotein YbaY
MISGTISSHRHRKQPRSILYKISLLDVSRASIPLKSIVEKQIQVEQDAEPLRFSLNSEEYESRINPLGRYLLRVQAVYEDRKATAIATAFREILLQEQTELNIVLIV